MKKILVLCFVLFALKAQAQIPKEIEAVKKSFAAYTTAIKNNDGKEALKYVDQNTITFFDTLLKEVVYADLAQLDSARIFDRLNVVYLRHLVDAKTLIDCKDGRSLFKIFVDSGIAGQGATKSLSIGKVDLQYLKGTALGQAEYEHKPVELVFHFVKNKNGLWQIEMSKYFKVMEKGFAQLIRTNKKSPNDYIVYFITLESGKTVSPNVWKALK